MTAGTIAGASSLRGSGGSSRSAALSAHLNMLRFHAWLKSDTVCHLQVVLCFSPVGFTLRTRARKFPALVNCTAVDWFHPWSQLALQSVSSTFIEKIPGLEVTATTRFFQCFVFVSCEIERIYCNNSSECLYITAQSAIIHQ